MASTLRETLASLKRSPLLAGLSSLMVGLALFVVGLFSLATHNLRLALASVEERVEVVAYLREDLRQVDLDAAVETLETLPGVEEVSYVSKPEALERAIRDLPEIAEVSSDLEVNPFPASLEVRFLPEWRTTETVEAVVAAAEPLPAVEDVRYGQEWVERLFFLRRIGGITALILGAAFATVATLIIGTAIRIAVFARREEIYVMRLVGARDSLIWRPFLLEGAVTGLVGGVLAILLTWITHQSVFHFLFELSWVPTSWVLGGLGIGVLFGILASNLAVRRYLREV
ncbi:MAG: ABC transporter permease [Gemmatimonadetes bacterium]|nr:ABC transporter permease [Gemmatimonadota bacterium]NNM06352.1 ABC transporter permease [Gemmatimonadota bacterium]